MGDTEMKHRSISIILLFIVSTMLIGLFLACEGIGDDPAVEYVDVFWQYTPELEPLTKSQIDAFNLACFIEKYGMTPEEYVEAAPEEEKDEARFIADGVVISYSMHDSNYLYLGTFNASIVVLIFGETMEGSVYRLGDYTLEIDQGNTVYVYNAGKIYGIEKAYEAGILTDEDIAVIVDRRNKYYNAKKALMRDEK